jgi:hypothetical protein
MNRHADKAGEEVEKGPPGTRTVFDAAAKHVYRNHSAHRLSNKNSSTSPVRPFPDRNGDSASRIGREFTKVTAAIAA